MDEMGCKSLRRSGKKRIIIEFLRYSVRHLSRLFVDKTDNQDLWVEIPLDWPKNLPEWRNPTGNKKDTRQQLEDKLKYLREVVLKEKLSVEDLKAFEDYDNKNVDGLESYLFFTRINDYLKELVRDLGKRQYLFLKASFKPAAVALKVTVNQLLEIIDPENNSKKRKHENILNVPCKIPKTEIKSSVDHLKSSGNGDKREIKTPYRKILPKPMDTWIGSLNNNNTTLSNNTSYHETTCDEEDLQNESKSKDFEHAINHKNSRNILKNHVYVSSKKESPKLFSGVAENSSTLPIDSGTLPIDSGTLPIDSGSLPIGSPTLPIGSPILPINSPTLPMDSPTLPIDSLTLPIGSPTLPIGSSTEFYGSTSSTNLTEAFNTELENQTESYKNDINDLADSLDIYLFSEILDNDDLI